MAPRKNNKASKNVPAKRGTTAPVNMTDQMAMDAEQSSGFESMDANDIAIPFIVILQALSPQVRGQGRIKGAAEGDFFNTVTNEVMKGELIVIPCAYEKAYIEWVPREKGGGFVRKYSEASILEQTQRNDKNNNVLPNGNHIVDTAYHYCLLVKNNEITEQIVIALTSTQLKKSRRWNSTMLSLKIKTKKGIITPPMFSHIYEVSTDEESNDYGAWSGWLFSNPKMINEPDLYMLAKKFHDDVTKGTVRTAPPPDMAEHSSNTSDTEIIDDDAVF